MIIKKENKGGVTVYHVDKDINDEQFAKLTNTFVKPSQIHTIIKDDADVYNEKGELLLIFRKNKLPDNNINTFYDNVIKFALRKTSNRGTATGSKKHHVGLNPKIMTNIIGYFDRFGPSQNKLLRDNGKKMVAVRATRFLMDYPEQYKKLIPLVKNIDDLYAKYVPDKYKKQRQKANQTFFKIPNTSFTTITTNVNFRTTVHTDRGDDAEGFGNLAVIEKGKYKGAETCFPQYGIGVDVRTGDVLFMNVHEWHGNLPMEKIDKDAQRLSIVCYLRKGVWEKTKNKTRKYMIDHNRELIRLGANKTRKNAKWW